jgi:hypothetical protein
VSTLTYSALQLIIKDAATAERRMNFEVFILFEFGY